MYVVAVAEGSASRPPPPQWGATRLTIDSPITTEMAEKQAQEELTYWLGEVRHGEPGLLRPEKRLDQHDSADRVLHEKFSTYGPVVLEGIGLSADAQQHVRGTLRLMLGIVGVLLLIAWANVGNLLILRGLRRRGETAVRQALGASRARLMQGHLAAGLLLAATGGGAGVLIAMAGTTLFRGKLLAWLPEIERVELDWRAMAFVLLLSLASALVVSILPIWAANSDLGGNAIREATRTSTRRAGWMRGGLVAAQVALATMLVICGLLLARTLTSLNRVDVGFDPERVLAFDIDARSPYFARSEPSSPPRLAVSASRTPASAPGGIEDFPKGGGLGVIPHVEPDPHVRHAGRHRPQPKEAVQVDVSDDGHLEPVVAGCASVGNRFANAPLAFLG
jgi:hypothetical protein